MTIKESLIEWLNKYPEFEIEDFIETDIAKNDGYAVAKEPNIIVKTFLDGTQLRTEYYTFIASLTTINDAIRKNNDKFLEDFESWIYQKRLTKDFPTLKENSYCENISISSGYYLQSEENKNGVYIFTIEITYRKGK